MSDSRKEMMKMLADKDGYLEKLERNRDKKKKRMEAEEAKKPKKRKHKDSSIVKEGKRVLHELKSGISHYGDGAKKAKKAALRKMAGKKDNE